MNDLTAHNGTPPANPENTEYGQKLGEVAVKMSEIILDRLNDPKVLRRIDTLALVDRLDRVVRTLTQKKNVNIMMPGAVTVNTERAMARARELENHPSRRKELRAEVHKLNAFPG